MKVILPHIQNIVGICRQNTIIILLLCWYPYLNSFMPLYKSLIFLFLLFVSNSLILSFRYSHFLLLKVLPVSRLTSFRLSPFVWLGFCSCFNLTFFLWSNNFERSSSNHDLCCFNTQSPRLYMTEVSMLSLILS